MFPDVVLASILVGLIRGGRLTKIPSVSKVWLLVFAVAFQLSTPLIPSAGPILMAASYVCLFALGLANWISPAFRVMTVGTLFNGLVIVANGGRMPVEEASALQLNYDMTYLYSTAFSQYVIARPETPLAFLGDVILLRYPIPRVISIGDMFAMLGLFLLVQEIMGKPLTNFGPADPLSERGD